jgi:hypothetical protein
VSLDKLPTGGIKEKMRIFRGRFLMRAFPEFGRRGERQENRLDLNYECEVLTTEMESFIQISRADAVFHRRRAKKFT